MWLLTGIGDMLTDQSSPEHVGQGDHIFKNEETQAAKRQLSRQFWLKTDSPVQMQSVPLYELNAAAGRPALFDASCRYVPAGHLQIPNLPLVTGVVCPRRLDGPAPESR